MSGKATTGYWMVKQEPETYSWTELLSEGKTDWTGVRNFQARNNLRAMKEGDRVLFYHSGGEKAVVGIAEVMRAAYPDPTADESNWVAVDLKPLKSLKQPVTLASIREQPRISDIPLIRQSRLSVMPLSKDQFETIVAMGDSRK